MNLRWKEYEIIVSTDWITTFDDNNRIFCGVTFASYDIMWLSKMDDVMIIHNDIALYNAKVRPQRISFLETNLSFWKENACEKCILCVKTAFYVKNACFHLFENQRQKTPWLSFTSLYSMRLPQKFLSSLMYENVDKLKHLATLYEFKSHKKLTLEPSFTCFLSFFNYFYGRESNTTK